MTTPLPWRMWQTGLSQHPDRAFTDYVVSGIRDGFRVGFDYAGRQCKRAAQNMASTREHPQVVSEYLAGECAEGRILGPFPQMGLPHLQVNRFGVIPKSTPGKWRLILDLSFPEGHSVNDGIAESVCSLSYISVDDAAQAVLKLGRGAQLAKVDIRNAYRVVPIHPEDRWLLGMQWEGALFVDTALPFGLRSTPKIFTAVADAVEWMGKHEGIGILYHYLDDFLTAGRPGTRECSQSVLALRALFDRLGIPIAEDKLEGPACSLSFLGIVIDSMAMELRLPNKKLSELKTLIGEWKSRRSCRKRDLQSLVGKLQHACKVVQPGRSFLRRMFELLSNTLKPYHHIRLNESFRSDLIWWDTFLESWNGVSILRDCRARSPDQEVFTDASGSFGCGAIWGGHWLQLQWALIFREEAIAQKELVPIVLACMIWGRQWQGSTIHFHCDNMAVVQVVNSGYSRDKQLMRLVRCLFFIRAAWQIELHVSHIPGSENILADAISRNNLSLLFLKAPQADPSPTPVPAPMIELVGGTQLDWLSPNWPRLFKTCLQLV